MTDLPREIADLCGIVVATTIEDEPVQTFYRYYVNQLTMAEWEVGIEKQGEKTVMGYIHRSGPLYRAASTNGSLQQCHSKKEAVEFIHAAYI